MNVQATLAGLVLSLSSVIGHEPDATTLQYPPWDGMESVEQYATRVNLPWRLALDLGNDVSLELVLIPAGKASIGTARPQVSWPAVGMLALGLMGAGTLAVIVFMRAWWWNKPCQWSLGSLLLFIFMVGMAMNGGFACWRIEMAQQRAKYDQIYVGDQDICRPFFMGKYEVTQRQYQQIVGDNPSDNKSPLLPVDMVSWEDAQAFCQAASVKTGRIVRLPNEVEWECACRAGSRTGYYSGDDEEALAQVGWYKRNSGMHMHAVGEKKPNGFGIYDMHGNVYEWCREMPVNRGGSYYEEAPFCRSAYRDRESTTGRELGYGLRVLVEIDQVLPDGGGTGGSTGDRDFTR